MDVIYREFWMLEMLNVEPVCRQAGVEWSENIHRLRTPDSRLRTPDSELSTLAYLLPALRIILIQKSDL